ncbi:hypothetical protein ACFL2V_08685 [Pseudomonadota bacterium]
MMVHDSNIESIKLKVNERMLLFLLCIGGLGGLLTAMLTYLLSSQLISVIFGLIFGVTITVLVTYFFLVYSHYSLFDPMIIRKKEKEDDFQSIMKIE